MRDTIFITEEVVRTDEILFALAFGISVLIRSFVFSLYFGGIIMNFSQ